MRLAVEVYPDATAAAERGAEIVAEHARIAVGERGRFVCAVSGGRTPALMLACLDAKELPWDRVDLFQVDERVAPAGDPDRNLTQLLAELPSCEQIHPMPVERDDLEDAAAAYAASLPARFDLLHLGLGSDGHTGSLVPGDPVLEVTDRDVAVTQPYLGRRRLTLTYRALARSRFVLWLVTGADKGDALRRLVEGDPTIPASRVPRDSSLVVADQAAASALPS